MSTDIDKYGAPLSIPCGQCIDCRVERSRQWAIRCMHEASLYEDNCFITLTYRNEELPPVASLVSEHLQLYMKRLREMVRALDGRTIRFYGCGEYGDKFGRPHYHILVFNFDPDDKTPWRKTPAGHQLYRSKALEKLWSKGTTEIGSVSFDSAGYVARYCVKKFSGPGSLDHYHVIDAEGRSHLRAPEFGRMSLRPGIGHPWLTKFHTDVYDFDKVLVNGRFMQPPKFYDRKYKFLYPEEFENIELDRMRSDWYSFRRLREDNVPERLEVKEEIASARLKFSKRNAE